MKKLLLILLFSATLYAENCPYTGEQQSGMSKMCFYNCISGTKVLNVKAIELCPITHYFPSSF